MGRLLWLSLCVFILVGCKTELSISVKISQLNRNTYTFIPAQLSIELDTCNEKEQPKRSSLSINELQHKIKELLPQATFIHCKVINNDYVQALFTLPITVGKLNLKQNNFLDRMLYVLGGDYSIYKNEQDNVVRYQSSPLLLTLSEKTRALFVNQLSSADKASNVLMGSQITLYIENDTGSTIDNIQVYGVYVNNRPYGITPEKIVLPAGREMIVKLSNVMLATLLSQNKPIEVLGFIPPSTPTIFSDKSQ